MAETLGMLCDKLTIVKLKQYHTTDEVRLVSLNKQCDQLQIEIDEYFSDGFAGNIPAERLTFASNKVFKQQGNEVKEIQGKIGEVFSQLADVNCKLWHEQEKVYEFETVPVDQKDTVVKLLALLNLERNKCIDAINLQFSELVLKKLNK
ncbi:MAG: hypothetical protein EBZ95_08580 [Chitinophagia bacterium]|jgi:hypothetical protein|nr:hypothetical protein [Chitinophagia bacterium]